MSSSRPHNQGQNRRTVAVDNVEITERHHNNQKFKHYLPIVHVYLYLGRLGQKVRSMTLFKGLGALDEGHQFFEDLSQKQQVVQM